MHWFFFFAAFVFYLTAGYTALWGKSCNDWIMIVKMTLWIVLAVTCVWFGSQLMGGKI